MYIHIYSSYGIRINILMEEYIDHGRTLLDTHRSFAIVCRGLELKKRNLKQCLDTQPMYMIFSL